MSEWRPIETAPRDGTNIIVMYLYCETECVFNAFYASIDEPGAGWEEEDVGWWSYVFGEVSRHKLDGYREPTHWMPLPPPPDAHNTHPAVNTEPTDDTDGGEVA